jgi:uncharacterized protein YqeY
MTIENQINQSFLSAYKNKDMNLKNFLGIIKGEMENVKKNIMVDSLPDAETMKILAKFVKGIKENIQHSNDPKFQWELSIVQGFMPKEMSRDEIEQKISELVSNGASNIGEIMKAFTTLAADKKVVSEIAKSKLS